MMKKLLVWLMVIVLCMGMVPSLAEDVDLDTIKENAKEELEEFDPDDYDEIFKELLEGILEEGKEAIDEAEDEEGVEDALEAAKEMAAKIPTNEEVEGKIAELVEKAESKFTDYTDYIDDKIEDLRRTLFEDYEDEMEAALNAVIDEAKSKLESEIEEAFYDAAKKAVEEEEVDIDAISDEVNIIDILEDVEEGIEKKLDDNFIAEAQKIAKKYIESYAVTEYPEQEAEVGFRKDDVLSGIAKKAIEDIDEAEDIDSMDDIVSAAETNIDNHIKANYVFYIYGEMDSDDHYYFDAEDINDICERVLGDNLSHIKITGITEGEGTIYYDYDDTRKEVGNEEYYRSSTTKKVISDLSFVTNLSFDGKVRIAYTGYVSAKESFKGEIVINVTAAEVKGDLEEISYDGKAGGRVKLSSEDFVEVCDLSGFNLNYIMFELPEESLGKLYYNYSTSSKNNKEVEANVKYYRDAKSSTTKIIDEISLVIPDTVKKSFEITYYAYDRYDEGYEGVISIEISENNKSNSISYEVSSENVKFVPRDFYDVCINKTGDRLSYVKFKSPSVGTLYYDYEEEDGNMSKVSTSKSYYYRSKSPELGLISYVPKDNYKGKVYVDYEAFSESGESYIGTVVINVDTKDGEKAPDIEYTIKNTSTKTFANSQFTSACTKAIDEKLDYVKFSTPSSGTLYYRYSARDDDNEKVSTSNEYYVSEEDYIKYVTYVPKSGFKGTATISYTGYSDEGTRFTGKIKIEVTAAATSSTSKKDDEEDTPDPIKYKGEKGKAIDFDGDDFFDICEDFSGDDLEYVIFTLPSAAAGKLYYDYGGKDEEEVKKGYEYYYEDDDMLISDVSFVPAKAGATTIKYTAVTVEEEKFSGTITINVAATEEGIGNFKYKRLYNTGIFSDMDEDEWYGSKQTGAVKLAYRYGLMSGRADGTFDPKGNITVAEAITIAARIHDIYYNNKTEFKAGNTWFEEYVNYAIDEGIVKKNDFTNYNKVISREEMAYIFANIIPEDVMEEINDVTGIPDVDEDNEYYYEILYLYNVGILSGSDAKGTFNPKANISRAEVSAIIVRIAAPEERRENNF